MRIDELPCPCKARGAHTIAEHEKRWGTSVRTRAEEEKSR